MKFNINYSYFVWNGIPYSILQNVAKILTYLARYPIWRDIQHSENLFHVLVLNSISPLLLIDRNRCAKKYGPKITAINRQ